MSQPFALNNFVPGSSRKPRNARTVLLRMAADQDRADRIRQLKQDHPEYTWQAIADHVGVSLRAAQSWQEKGGIEYENAKKLAALWDEDLDYIMRGPRNETPDLSLAPQADGNDLGRIAARLEKLEIAVHEQNDLLARQSRLLAKIEELVRVLEGVDVVSESAGDGAADLGKPAAAPEGLGLDVRNQQPSPRRRRAKDAQSRDRRRDVS